ncbi:hypothetical protein FHG87_017870, partial [Trinorchestia longiramus]
NNARPHFAKQTREKIKSLGLKLLPHPPYSPHLGPFDFHLFRSLEHFISGKIFTNVHEV